MNNLRQQQKTTGSATVRNFRDQTAFRTLYRATSPKLFGVAMRILNDAEKASDAVQEAYLQIWRNADRFDPEKGKLEGWMVGIVRFRALDALRRARARAAMTSDEFDTENMQAESPSQQTNAPEMTIALWNCIDRLSIDQKKCILDAHFRGYTHEELSMRYEMALGTIKSRLRRGLFALKECLDQ